MLDPDLLLPEGTRLLHIGPHKTGTTALQYALHDARAALETAGVVRLGKSAHESKAVSHVVGRRGLGTASERAKRWRRLTRQAAALTTERAVLSSEFFAEADDAGVDRVIGDLRPNVHVVVTLRPLARILPSQWQQFLLRGLVQPYDQWLDILLSPDQESHPESVRFWHRHRHDALVERWAHVVGPENVTVVVLDPSDRSMLGATFESMLGLPASTLTVDRVGNAGDNRSFTHAEAEMLRAFNELARHPDNTGLLRTRGLTATGYGFAIKRRTPGSDEAQITTPAWAMEHAGRIGAAMAANLRTSGVRVVGDLDELASTDGRSGPLVGDPLLPPAVAAGFAVAIHDSRRVVDESAALDVRPGPSPLTTASAQALIGELRRRVRRRFAP